MQCATESPPLTLGYPALMDKEREFRMAAVQQALERFQREGTLSRAETITLIEDVAALGRHADPYRDQMLKVMQAVLGFPRVGTGPKTMDFLKDRPPTRTSRIALGITAYTSWDKRLVRLACDPVEWERRARWLSLLGVGQDEVGDVSVRHDEFLAEAWRE